MTRRIVRPAKPVSESPSSVDPKSPLVQKLRSLPRGELVERDRLVERILSEQGVSGLLVVLEAADVDHRDDQDTLWGTVDGCVARDPAGACDVARGALASTEVQTRAHGARILSLVAWASERGELALELLVSAAADASARIARFALEGLSCPWLPDSEARAAVLRSAAKQKHLRDVALRALAGLRDEAQLAGALEDIDAADEEGLVAALDALKDASGQAADTAVARLTRHESSRVAARASEIDDERGRVRGALHALRDEAADSRTAAAGVLWLSLRHDVVSALAERVEDPAVRSQAIVALTRLPLPRIRAARLERYLHDPDVSVRRLLSAALGKSGQLEAIHVLTKDPDALASRNAKSALWLAEHRKS